MGIKKVFAASLLAALILLACTSREAPLPQEKALPQIREGTALQPGSKEAWEIKWEEAIQAGKKEGKVVIHATSVGPYLKEFTPLIQKKFGLDLEIITRRGGEIMTAIFSERRAGLFTVDILITGLNTFFGQIEPAGLAAPLEPVLILPEILDKKDWYEGELHWANPERTALNMYAYPNAMIALNTAMVKAEEIKSYRDILNPKYKGKIIMNDPTLAGTGLKSFSVLGWHILDIEFFRQLAKQELMITRDQRQQVDWLTRGRYTILLFPRTLDMTEYINAGAPIAWADPEEGSYLSRDGGAVSLVKDAPHPKAATVLINWIFSREGLTLFPKLHGVQSARTDVPIEGINPLQLRKPGVKYFAGADTREWIARDDEYIRTAQELFGYLLR